QRESGPAAGVATVADFWQHHRRRHRSSRHRVRSQVCLLMSVLLPLLLLLAAQPHKAADLAASGWKAFEEGRLADAERDLQEATRLAPANASISLALGQTYLSAGKPRLAIPQFEKAMRGLGNPPDVRFALAQAYQAVDQDTKALAVLAGRPPE